jgi:hypothetical protein
MSKFSPTEAEEIARNLSFVRLLRIDGMMDKTIVKCLSDRQLRLRMIRAVQPVQYALPSEAPDEAVDSVLDFVFGEDSSDRNPYSLWPNLRRLMETALSQSEQRAVAAVHGLSFRGKRSYREAGDLLDISSSLVARRLKLARSKLLRRALINRARGGHFIEADIAALDLPKRVEMPLEHAGIKTVGGLIQQNADDLLELINFGEPQLAVVRSSLKAMGLRLKDDQPTT